MRPTRMRLGCSVMCLSRIVEITLVILSGAKNPRILFVAAHAVPFAKMLLARNIEGLVLLLFGRRVSNKPDALFFDQLGGCFAQVADSFERELAGDVVGLAVSRGLEDRGPALGCLDQFGQGFAHVAVGRPVVVET